MGERVLDREARDVIIQDGRAVAHYLFKHLILEDDDGNMYILEPIIGLGIETA